MFKQTVPFIIKNLPQDQYFLRLYAGGDGFFTFENQFLIGGDIEQILEDRTYKARLKPLKYLCTTVPDGIGGVNVTVPSVNITATSDLGTEARYALAEVVSSSGKQIILLTDFIVSAEIASPVTWQQIELSNQPAKRKNGGCGCGSVISGISHEEATALVQTVASQANNAITVANQSIDIAGAAVDTLNDALDGIQDLQNTAYTAKSGEEVLKTRVVKNSTTLLSFTSQRQLDVLAVSVEYENCVRSAVDIVATVAVNGYSAGTITLPGHQGSMNLEANAQRDVRRPYFLLLTEPLRPGDVMTVTIPQATAKQLRTTVYSAFANRPLADKSLKWVRPHRLAGTPSTDTFPVQQTHIAMGNQIHLDPFCAPQNNSAIIRKPGDSIYYNFTSFYSIDEQHDPAGRNGNQSRIFGFRSIALQESHPFLDNFTRSDTSPVVAGGTGAGNGWIQSAPSSFSPTTANVRINGNKLIVFNPQQNGGILRPTAALEFDFSVKVVSFGATSGGVHLYGNAATSFNTLYIFGVYRNSHVYLLKVQNGTVTTIRDTTRQLQAGDKLRFNRTGNTLRGYVTPAATTEAPNPVEVEVFPAYTDTAPLPLGRVGVGADYLDAKLDDFSFPQEIITSPILDSDGKQAYDWELINNGNPVVDLIPGSADQSQACGDPQLFLGKNDLCCLVWDAANGTNGFADFTQTSIKIRTSNTFEGLAAANSFTLYTRPRGNGNIYCPRIVYRPLTDDYLLIVNIHDEYNNRRFVALVLPNLTTPITDADINNAPVIIQNNEEGGNSFVRRGRLYLTTWQVPSLNTPTAVQRVYSAPLGEATNPDKWVVENLSWWRNTPSDARQAGGVTADSIAMWCDEATDELWVTACTWSGSFNYLLWSRKQYAQLHGKALHVACPTGVDKAHTPFEIPVAIKSRITLTVTPQSGTGFGIVLGGDPNSSQLDANYQTIAVISATTYVLQTDAGGGVSQLGTTAGMGFVVGTPITLSVEVSGDKFTIYNAAGGQVLQTTIPSADALDNILTGAARWKISVGTGAEVLVTDVRIDQ